MEKGKKCSHVKCQHSNMLVTKHGAWLNFMLPWITNNLQSYRATGLIFLLNWQSFDPGICHLACWKKKSVTGFFFFHLYKTIKWCKKFYLLNWELYGTHYTWNFFIAELVLAGALYAYRKQCSTCLPLSRFKAACSPFKKLK